MAAVQNLASRVKLGVERARADHAAVDVTMRVAKRYSEDDGGFYAAALTYYAFFSIFPMLLFTASALGYLTLFSEDFEQRLLDAGVRAFPLVDSILRVRSLEAIQEQRGMLALLGLLLALYSGSGGIVALQHALNRIAGADSEPSFIPKRINSLKWLGAFGIAILFAVALGVVTEALVRMATGFAADVLAFVLGHLAGLAVGLLVFVSAFKFLPACRLGWRDVLPGAALAAVVFELLKIGGAWYLAQGAQARRATFGAFAAAAGLLVASYLLAQITLLGAEVNAVLAERRRTRQSSVASG